MATVELDPVFVKALKYLHSKSHDSTEKLKKLLDDAIAQRKGQKADHKLSSRDIQKQKDEDKPKKTETEKRTFDKLKQDLSDLTDEVPVKKPRKDSPHRSSSPAHVKEVKLEVDIKVEDKSRKDGKDRDKGRKEMEKRPIKLEKEDHSEVKIKVKNEDTDEDEKSFDADVFAVGLGIACVVCEGFDVSSGNQLVECNECHTLYHQECHKPPVTEQDVNDPRFVWYCSRCTKSMKKMVKSNSKGKTTSVTKEIVPASVSSTQNNSAVVISTTTTTTTSSSSSSSSSYVASIKTPKTESSTLLPFRRVENKPSGVKDNSNNAGNRPLSGLASLAANLSGKSESAKTGHGRSESGKPGMVRSESAKSLLSVQKDKSQDKVSLLNPVKVSKSGETSKPGGGIKFGVDIFKGLPKTAEQIKSSSKSYDSSKPSQKPGEHVKTMSKSASISDLGKYSSKSSDSIKSSMKSADFAKPGLKTSSDPSKSGLKSDHMKISSSSSSSSSSASKISSVSSSSSSSSSVKQPQGGTSSVVHADKRLQMMKKKAAAKLQEKRASLK